MFSHSVSMRVRYADTDQMGYVYYGRYAEYLEVGRVETLRALGVVYAELEAKGIWLPVHNLQITYKTPARYDDELRVKVTISDMPAVRILFRYVIHNAQNQEVCTAETTLFFLDATSRKPMRIPDEVAKALRPYFGKSF